MLHCLDPLLKFALVILWRQRIYLDERNKQVEGTPCHKIVDLINFRTVAKGFQKEQIFIYLPELFGAQIERVGLRLGMESLLDCCWPVIACVLLFLEFLVLDHKIVLGEFVLLLPQENNIVQAQLFAVCHCFLDETKAFLVLDYFSQDL